MRYANEVPRDDLYIPHGSDESIQEKKNAFGTERLYIPHGSDERIAKYENVLLLVAFISHMVQMKAYMHCVKKKQ